MKNILSNEKKQIRKFFYFFVSIILTLGLSISLQSLLAAWTAPTASPPSGNTNPPVYDESSLSGIQIADDVQVIGGYIEDVTGKLARNLVGSNVWNIGSGSIGNFTQNGATAENVREWGLGPHGNRTILWTAYNDATSDADGGWNFYNIPIKHLKAYRVSVWIKKTGSTSGNTYIGCSGSATNNLNGTAKTNPYFWEGDLPELNKWYLLVAYIHGSGDTSTTSYGGIYDGVTGKKVINMTDFKNRPDFSEHWKSVWSQRERIIGQLGVNFHDVKDENFTVEIVDGKPLVRILDFKTTSLKK